MKILAIGDFHGKFPKKFFGIAKKNKIDAVISVGDFLAFTYRKLWFKCCYGQDINLWDIIGRKKFVKMEMQNLRTGERVFKLLDKLPTPVYSITGNVDRTKIKDAYDDSKEKREKWRWPYQDFLAAMFKAHKNVHNFDFSYFRLGSLIFIGYPKSSFPGQVKSRNYRIHRKKMEALFRKFSKEDREKRLIFVSHNVPYNTKLDKIMAKHAEEQVKGKHYGSKLVKRLITKYRPALVIAGHIHEGFGKQKLGKSLVVNVGAAHDGKAAIIDYPDNGKGKIKVKFIK